MAENVRLTNTAIGQLRKALADYDATADSYGLDLRLSFSRLVLEQLRDRGWTQKQLATKCGRRESFISRILHGDENFTTETAGRILHALHVRPVIVERYEGSANLTYAAPSIMFCNESIADGQTKDLKYEEEFTAEGRFTTNKRKLRRASC